jgi:hypothetical protein
MITFTELILLYPEHMDNFRPPQYTQKSKAIKFQEGRFICKTNKRHHVDMNSARELNVLASWINEYDPAKKNTNILS